MKDFLVTVPGKLELYFNELIFHDYAGRACWALTTLVMDYKRNFQYITCTLLFQFLSLSAWIKMGGRAGIPLTPTSCDLLVL